jgi:hypothetical protein
MHESNQRPWNGPPGAAQRALRTYLWVFLVLSVSGWLPEVAGRLGAPWVSADFSALFHPRDTFIGDSSAFYDLTDFAGRMKPLSGPGLAGPGGPFPYPPAAAYVFAFFLRLFPNPVAAYLVAFAAALGLVALILWRDLGPARTGLAGAALGSALLLGSPQIATANRGNIEWVNWALTVAAVIAFTRRRYLWTAVLLGIAVSVKPFPAVFFALLIWRRRYREAAIGVGVALAISLLALAALGPTIPAAAHGLSLCWADYYTHYVLLVRPSEEFRFNHSLLDAVKLPIFFLFDRQCFDPRPMTSSVPGIPLWARLDLWAHAIAAFSVASLSWIVWRFRRMPLLNGVFALAIAEMLLPYSAAEYTTLLMYLPWGLLLAAIARGSVPGQPQLTLSQMNRILLPCAVLFTPLSFMSILAGFTKTLALLFLFVQVCLTPLPGGSLGEPATSGELAEREQECA